MKACYYLLGCLALAACDAQEPQVSVNFDQPFPAGEADLTGFLPRDRQRYAVSWDANRRLIIGEKVLLQSRVDVGDFSGAFLDSAGIPRRPGLNTGRTGQLYKVQVLAADSFRVRTEGYDTLLNLNSLHPHKLRRYRGWYYVSTSAPDDSTKWEIQRLGIVDGKVVQQVFNPDSLRIQALDPAIVQRRHYKGKLIITLSPQSRQAAKQVSSYAGLWLNMDEYLASVLSDK